MIYVIEAGIDGPLKIGTAFRPEQRKKGLQVGNHNDLTILMTFEGGPALETQIHKDLEQYKIRKDGEWFHHVEGVLSYLIKLQTVNPKTETHDGKEYITLWRETVESMTDFCPFCGSRHQHGIGDGHRVSHCAPGEETFTRQSDGKVFYQKNGYFVRTKNNQQIGTHNKA